MSSLPQLITLGGGHGHSLRYLSSNQTGPLLYAYDLLRKQAYRHMWI